MLSSMRDGDYTYYTIQFRYTHQSEWLKPEGPLEPYETEWMMTGSDGFGKGLDPWEGRGNDYKPKFRESHEERRAVRFATGSGGWWTLKFAADAITRVRLLDMEGVFDPTDTRGEKTRAIRRQYRVIKVHVTQETEILQL